MQIEKQTVKGNHLIGKKDKMKLLDESSASTQLIPMVLSIFITTIIMYVLSFVVSPIFQIVYQLTPIMDVSGSLYTDVGGKFDTAVKAWSFLIILVIVKQLMHFGLIAIKQRRVEGSFESDF